MKISAESSPDHWHYEITDLETGEHIDTVKELDSDDGVLTRYVRGQSGLLQQGDDGQLVTIREKRQFRVTDRRNGEEICRTGLVGNIMDHLRY